MLYSRSAMGILHRFLGLFLVAGFALAANAAPPNVVLITIDTTRADRMGFLGSQRGLTPNLDVLAKQGVVFRRAYAQVPLTTPSHAVILTGTYPQFSHVNDFAVPLGKELPYLPDILHQHGYKTAAFVGSIILDPYAGTAPGFDRGFDTYNAGFLGAARGKDIYQTLQRRGGEVVARASAWVNENRGAPFFLWIHLFDPHNPYDPPEPFKTKYASEPYDGEIAYADSAVGQLLDQLRTLGIYDNALIAVMADHGEGLGDHGENTHGIFLYDETIHVPLLFKMPAKRWAGTQVEARAGLVDVMPTILEVAGISLPAAAQGVSLLAVMQPADKTAPDRPAYSETDYPQRSYGWSSEQAWRASKYLFIQAPRKELYDWTTDPGAKRDLSSTSAAVTNTLAEQLNTFRRRTTNSSKAPELAASPQREAQLAALGYLASSHTGHATAPGQAMADPKDKIEIANQLEEALIAQQEGRLEDAIPLMQKVLAKDPNMAAAYQGLGSAWLGLKNYDKALPALRKAVELRPDSIIAREALAKALYESGDMKASASELQAALTISPGSTHLRISLAAAYERLGRAPDARKELETTLQMDPESYEANFILGRILGQYWTASDALPYLEKAAELRPDSAEAHAALAQAYSSMGQEANAIRERMLAQRARMLEGR